MKRHIAEAAYATEKPPYPEQISTRGEYASRQLGRTSLEGLTYAMAPEHNPLSDIEEGLNDAIVGQPEAIKSIVDALSREKIRNPSRPIANLLFLGPTGVGKSETAKVLAELLHDEYDEAFLKIDCSSYSESHQVNALIGAPQGYVGREQQPFLDPSIIEQEKSVILFDELEKGSEELYDLMLQIMEDGELFLPGTGETVSFKNSIIIMTSNLGASEMMNLLNPKKTGFYTEQTEVISATKEQLDSAVNIALEKHFRPEFINRIDRRVVFESLGDTQLEEVLDRYVKEANERYFYDAKIDFRLSPELRHKLVSSNEKRRQFGARPILRGYDHIVESKLATYLSAGSIPEGSRVYAVAADETDDNPSSVDFYYEPDYELQRNLKEIEERVRREMREAREAHTSTELVRRDPDSMNFLPPPDLDDEA